MLADVYPNPFTDIVTVHLKNEGLSVEEFQIEVYNQMGVKVRTFVKTTYNSKIELNLGGVLPGMYFIRINPNKLSNYEGAILKVIKLR